MSITCSQCQHRNSKDAKFCKECGLRLTRSADPLIGQQIGNHRLVKRIGVGGMGVVYLAEHINLGKKYAVKFLHPQFASDEEVVERFRREAQVIAGLDHENIIRENDFGWLDGVGFYLIMEYLEGETLKELIRREPHIPIEHVLSMFAQLMDALDEAHNQSVIHRDLKPENIFLVKRRGREQLKILDFGIARVIMDGPHKDFTVDGEVYGSPTYMSPEQARGEISKVDHRADLYAVGIILVEILTGRPPYQGATPAEVMLAHISGLPPRLSDLAPGVRFAAGLEDLVLKALAKEADERFQSAAEFWEALEPMLEKTLDLQKEIDETIDVPPPSRLPSVASSARVLVSRDGTPTPSNDYPSQQPDANASSQPSMHGAQSHTGAGIRSDVSPAPTAEMPGQAASPAGGYHNSAPPPMVGYGDPAAQQDPQYQVHPGSITDLKQVSQNPEMTPATPSPMPPSGLSSSSTHEDSFPQPGGSSPRPLTAPGDDLLSDSHSALNAFHEEGDEDPTTVSFLGRSLPITPPKSDPPSISSSPSTVITSLPFQVDVLESRDKTAQQYRDHTPSTIAQPQPTFHPHTPYPAPVTPYISPGTPSGNRRVPTMEQTQSQELPSLPAIKQPALVSFFKHPAFLGGLVGFCLLLGVWMLLPKRPQHQANTPDGGDDANQIIQQPTLYPPTRPERRRPDRTRLPLQPRKPNIRINPVPLRPVSTQEMVTFRIETRPPGANVYMTIGGKSQGKLGKTPYTAQVPKGTYATIHIRMMGYRGVDLPWPGNASTSNTITLSPID